MSESEKEEIVLKGIAASPGVAHGPAFAFLKKDVDIPAFKVPEEKQEEEIARFEQGLLETRKQISAIRAEIEERLSEEEAQIFDAHMLVLEDRALIEETIREVTETSYNIEHCFQAVASRYVEAFSKIDDPYIKERVSDIRDVSRRLLHNLLGKSDINLRHLRDERVIVSDDLAPSDTANVDRDKVLAIATDYGSRTSHAVIMARSINVPAVVGLHEISRKVRAGDEILVDGYDGVVIINPSEQSLFKYGKIRIERQNIQKLFATAIDKVAETKDGHRVQVMLNVEGFEGENIVRGSGAEGIGLFRTEALFLRSSRFPSEEEQFAAYRRVVEAANPHPVIIRTLDLGGDKNPEGGLYGYDEANPFMGFRAIRFCLEQGGIFKEQLRAILRASAYGKAQIMYPMISSVGELKKANELLAEAKGELDRQGVAFDPDVPVGSMIEIPSAAYSMDLLAKHCDFFSVGTNDLVQYMLAVDRVNDRIAHLYEPNHPAIIRTLKQIFEDGKAANMPVGVCGEMAGDPVYAALFFGFGATSISVAANAVAEVKYFIRSIQIDDARTLANHVLECTDPTAVAQALQDFYHKTLGMEYPQR